MICPDETVPTVGNADVKEFSAVVAEYHEAEEQAKGQGRYDEEVDGRDVVTGLGF